jgi:predicted signal transduction protein with EAL and GGDEF domain
VRASFGVASCPEDATDAHVLFRRADEALYMAKRSGSGLQFVA